MTKEVQEAHWPALEPEGSKACEPACPQVSHGKAEAGPAYKPLNNGASTMTEILEAILQAALAASAASQPAAGTMLSND